MIRFLLILTLTVLVTNAIAAPGYTWRAGGSTADTIDTGEHDLHRFRE